MDNAFHEYFMRLALREAGKAAAAGEVPTGCVIIEAPQPGADPRTVKVIARAHNQTETLKDPTAHAEMIAITQAAAARQDWRLNGAVLYVTKEPCAMCAGAIILARLDAVVFGLADPKRGGHSLFGILGHANLNHRPELINGVLGDECLSLFRSFFQACRQPETGDRPHKPLPG